MIYEMSITKRKPTLMPLNVRARLHEKTKVIAALSKMGIAEVADELFLPVAEKREAQLISEAANIGKAMK